MRTSIVKLDVQRDKDHKKALDDLATALNISKPSLLSELEKPVATKTVKAAGDVIQVTHIPQKKGGKQFNLCVYSQAQTQSFALLDKSIRDFNLARKNRGWKIPSITEFLALDAGKIPPVNQRALYWTSTPADGGGVWMIEKEYEKRENIPDPVIRISFFNSKRYDAKNTLEAYLLPVRDCTGF